MTGSLDSSPAPGAGAEGHVWTARCRSRPRTARRGGGRCGPRATGKCRPGRVYTGPKKKSPHNLLGLVQPPLRVSVAAEREQVGAPPRVLDRDHTVGEQQNGVRNVRAVHGGRAAVGLALVAEVADEAAEQAARQLPGGARSYARRARGPARRRSTRTRPCAPRRRGLSPAPPARRIRAPGARGPRRCPDRSTAQGASARWRSPARTRRQHRRRAVRRATRSRVRPRASARAAAREPRRRRRRAEGQRNRGGGTATLLGRGTRAAEWRRARA